MPKYTKTTHAPTEEPTRAPTPGPTSDAKHTTPNIIVLVLDDVPFQRLGYVCSGWHGSAIEYGNYPTQNIDGSPESASSKFVLLTGRFSTT